MKQKLRAIALCFITLAVLSLGAANLIRYGQTNFADQYLLTTSSPSFGQVTAANIYGTVKMVSKDIYGSDSATQDLYLFSSSVLGSPGNVFINWGATPTPTPTSYATGRIYLGGPNFYVNAGGTCQLENGARFNSAAHSNTSTVTSFFFGQKTRGTITAPETVIVGDILGGFGGQGGTIDGAGATTYRTAAKIDFACDATPIPTPTPSPTMVPGRIMFHTQPSAAGGIVERLRIDSTGLATFYDNVTLGNAAADITTFIGTRVETRRSLANGATTTTQRKVSLSIATPTTGSMMIFQNSSTAVSSNMQISTDNGSTYFNVLKASDNTTAVTAVSASATFEAYFDGSNWIYMQQ